MLTCTSCGASIDVVSARPLRCPLCGAALPTGRLRVLESRRSFVKVIGWCPYCEQDHPSEVTHELIDEALVVLPGPVSEEEE